MPRFGDLGRDVGAGPQVRVDVRQHERPRRRRRGDGRDARRREVVVADLVVGQGAFADEDGDAPHEGTERLAGAGIAAVPEREPCSVQPVGEALVRVRRLVGGQAQVSAHRHRISRLDLVDADGEPGIEREVAERGGKAFEERPRPARTPDVQRLRPRRRQPVLEREQEPGQRAHVVGVEVGEHEVAELGPGQSDAGHPLHRPGAAIEEEPSASCRHPVR